MTGVKDILKKNKIFFFCYAVILIAGITFLLIKGKRESFLILNSSHSSAADTFFIVFTYLGDGLFAVALSLFYFFVLKKRREGLTFLVAYALTGIVAQVIKSFVFSPRPLVYFHPEVFSFFIDGIIHGGNRSFPSGHTATAFAIATIFAYYTNSAWKYFLLLFLASLVGFSRVYLSQHFLLDVLAGSVLGILGGALCLNWCSRLDERKLTPWVKNKL
ncbi:MAG: phosphatase PAP2 family protein [Ferruginibacter sp.]